MEANGRGDIIKNSFMSFAFEKITRISLLCKLVPFQYQDFVSFLKRMFSHKVLGFCAQSAVTNMHWHWLKKTVFSQPQAIGPQM